MPWTKHCPNILHQLPDLCFTSDQEKGIVSIPLSRKETSGTRLPVPPSGLMSWSEIEWGCTLQDLLQGLPHSQQAPAHRASPFMTIKVFFIVTSPSSAFLHSTFHNEATTLSIITRCLDCVWFLWLSTLSEIHQAADRTSWSIHKRLYGRGSQKGF